MSDIHVEATDLPVACPDCGGQLYATVGPPNPLAESATWACPYCKRIHTSDFGGRLYWIVERRRPVSRT